MTERTVKGSIDLTGRDDRELKARIARFAQAIARRQGEIVRIGVQLATVCPGFRATVVYQLPSSASA